ncbi:MAG TPA: carboxypeptidase-like regulatory domain-containing protein, partial [Puia sp.]|nr:carboxypeptidase-like regulatory domain-containing protein [Puia sp.]
MILFPGTFFGRRLLFAPHLCRHSMRISILLLAATLTVGQLLRASPGYSQDVDSIHVTIGLSNGSLRDAFARIEKQTTLLFAYQPQQVAGFVKINLPRATRTLKATLDLLFKGTDLEYRVSGNNIIVYRPKKTGLSDPLSAPDLSALNMPLTDTPVVIRGRVVDKDGHPIPGAGITLKRTNRETSTQENGEFIVRVRNTETHLLVHCVGYQAREVTLTPGKNYYVLTLESSTTTLKDMVVTGVIRRSNESFTGAVTTFTAEQLRTTGNQNTIASLKALDPSFQVFDNIQAGSNPNTLPNIQLRGASNLPDLKGDYTGNPNVPLFILDGFEVPLQKIFDLDMNRVEKVTILKDATGTALYGSRGANGVVVVNTKQPEPGKLRVSYTGDFTLETPDLSAYHLLDG